eukprot:TRINITY_DN2457_c0_g1_i5.p1 TRINITY_DN2457_c0_g1~~TRINITY_DN2457_c0_g1_i5.p1  ORF type:complete len:579 (-),score=48.06 TRINITY_DN2457_c0_g1_i5:101-1837(-)
MDKEGDDANCNYGQMEAIDLPEDVYPCDGWPDYSSYAHVRANKLHNGLFMIDGILFAFFKKVDKPQQLWTQTKEEKAQVFYWSKHINKTKLRDKPFFVKKKRRNARYFKWHLYCWDQRQGWQYIIDMGYYREDGNLATRRFPPTVVHIQERQKQDNRFRLLISQGEGSVRFVEIFDCEEQFEKQIEWDKINLRNQDLLHEIDVDISLEYGRDICSSSDAINLLLASPPVRAVYPIYLESAILDNDTGLVRCVFWSMAQDMSNGTTTYMAILRLAINECSWSEQYSLEILQIVKLTESSIQPYVVFDNPIQNTILVVKCLVQLNGQVQNQYGGSEKDNDCKQKDDDDVSEEAVEQENEQEEDQKEEQEMWTERFPKCWEVFDGAKEQMAGLVIELFNVKENEEVTKLQTLEVSQYQYLANNYQFHDCGGQLLVLDKQGDGRIIQPTLIGEKLVVQDIKRISQLQSVVSTRLKTVKFLVNSQCSSSRTSIVIVNSDGNVRDICCERNQLCNKQWSVLQNVESQLTKSESSQQSVQQLNDKNHLNNERVYGMNVSKNELVFVLTNKRLIKICQQVSTKMFD